MDLNGVGQPLLSAAVGAAPRQHSVNSSTPSFTADENDIKPINSPRDFFREFYVETKKLWCLAGPAIFMSLCQYSLGAATQLFAGHVSTIALAAVAVENSIIAGFSMGAMLGMGCALETLCGQAFGAGRIDMLGVYMQRSWVILNCTAILLMFLYIFAAPFLKLIGQDAEIAEAAGTLAIYMIPQLLAYAFNFPMAKFLQAQSKMMAMAVISGIVLVIHTSLSWLLMIKLGWGLVGAAVALNSSWFLIVVSQMAYILSGTCGRAWSGFSWGAFRNLWGFVRLSLASAVMLCLEIWYYMALILFAGYLKNAEIAVDALSIWGGDWRRVASFRGVCEHRLLLPVWDADGSYLGLQARLRSSGYLDRYDIRHIRSDCHPPTHGLQDQLEQRGRDCYGSDQEMGRRSCRPPPTKGYRKLNFVHYHATSQNKLFQP